MSRGRGWHQHPNEHALASKGIKTKIKTKGNFETNPNYTLEDYEDYAEHLVESGVSPSLHFPNMVGPSGLMTIDRDLSKDERMELMEELDIDKDYPFVEIQVANVPIEIWADVMDIEQPNILFLGLNSGVSEIHNAVVSALDIETRYEFNEYLKHGDLSGTNQKIEKAIEEEKIIPAGFGGYHEDYAHYWESRSDEEKKKLTEELFRDVGFIDEDGNLETEWKEKSDVTRLR